MRFRSIASEALRNVGTRSNKPILALVVFLVMIGSLAYFDVHTLRGVIADARAFETSGATVHVLSTTKGINGQACENLDSLTGVRASGALRQAGSIRIATMPGSSVPLMQVTPNFIKLLPNDSTRGGVGYYLADQLADVLAVSAGDELMLTSGPVRVAGVYEYPDDGRLAGLGWAALEVGLATGRYDACWTDVPHPTGGAETFLFTSVAMGATEKPTLGQLNSRLGEKLDSARNASERSSLLAVPSALGLGLVLGFVLNRLRRLELSSALHIGVSKSALALQTLLETTVWVLPACFLLMSAAFGYVALELPIDRWSLLAAAGRIVVLGMLGLFIGALLGVATVRERDLFKYFKDR